MVIKVVALGVVVAVGVGIAVYEQREPLREFADRQRVKLAELLRRLADELSSEPIAYGGRRRPSTSSSSSSPENPDNFTYRDFSEKSIPEKDGENSREELNEKGETSAMDNTAGDAGLRRRGGGGNPLDSSVIFETGESSTLVGPQQEEESGYETGLPPRSVSSGRATPTSHTLSDPDFETYRSIHEWQENTAAAQEVESVSSASLAGSGDSDMGSDVDIQSVAGSWTEVDSVVSDDPFA